MEELRRAAELPEVDAHGPLSAEDIRLLEACEERRRRFELAFYEVGMAIEVFLKRKLHRGKYRTAEEYLEFEWGFKKSQADRLRSVWRIGQALGELARKSNERQLRHLVPLAKSQGPEQAAAVYRELAAQAAQTQTRMTGDLVEAVAGILPEGELSEEAVKKAVAEVLSGKPVPAPRKVVRARAVPRPAEAFEKLGRTLESHINDGDFVQAAKADPDQARKALMGVREKVEQLLRELEG